MHPTAAEGIVKISESARMGRGQWLEFGLATSSDDADLLRLMRQNVMPGRVSLGLECEPSFFDAFSIEGYRGQILVAREPHSGRIVGMGARSVRSVNVNGRVMNVGYLSHLRIDSEHRRRSRLRTAGFALARALRREDEAPFDLTCILADNLPARRLFAAAPRVRGLPNYVEYDRLVTLAIATRRGARQSGLSAIKIEAGSIKWLGEIVACLNRNNRRFQFASCWTIEDLLSKERSRGLRPEDFHIALESGRVVGVVARWDQRTFKQLVVRDYAPGLRRWRTLVNCLSPLTRLPPLPAIGEPVNSVFLSHVAIDNDDPAVALALIEDARREALARGHHLLMMGLSKRHPLLPPICRTIAHRACESIFYIVNWTNERELVEEFDARVPHPEIATL